jgi:Zn-dependent metalloprotease
MTQPSRKFLSILFALCFTALPGYSQVEPDTARQAAWQQFQSQHGPDWQVRWHSKTGTPRTVTAGTTKPYPGPPEQAARMFFAEHHRLFGMESGLPGLKLKSVRPLREVTHVRFQQTYQDLPVYDTEYLVHFRQDGRVIMTNGTYYPSIDVSTSPGISERTAQRIAIDDIGDRDVRGDVENTLLIYPRDGQFHLAWKLTVPLAPNGGWDYFVDAQTGTILRRQNLLVDVVGDGKVYPKHPDNSSVTITNLYRLDGTGYLRGTYVNVVNDEANRAQSASHSFQYSPSNTHFDEVNLYHHVDRFRNDFIEGLEDANNPLGFTQITAHAHSTCNGSDVNACFDRNTGELHFGDASSDPFFNDFAKEDKVIYHEYTHAVIDDQNSGILSTCEEEGAISEGVSDYFAGAHTGRSKIGDYVFASFPSAVRDMSDPVFATYSDYQAADGNYPNACPSTSGVDVEPHDGGELFSAVLWDLRNASGISASEANWLAYAALSYVSADPDFLEYRAAMLAEDDAAYGGQHACIIKHAFAGRGIGSAVAVTISGPSQLNGGEQGTWSTSVTCPQGAVSYQWYEKFDGETSFSPISGATSSSYAASYW